MEYREIFTDKNGTEVEIKMKSECRSSEGTRQALRFMAESSRKFYLRVAEKLNSTSVEVQPSFYSDRQQSQVFIPEDSNEKHIENSTKGNC